MSAAAALDRATFFDEQARHRRAAAAWSACLLAFALVLAVVTSVVLTPLVLILGAGIARLIHAVLPLPPWIWDVFRDAVSLLDAAKVALSDQDLSVVEIRELAPGFAVLLVPGMALVLALSAALRGALFRRGGHHVALAIGARPPREADLREGQLVHTVEEMAIAAGMSPPRLLLLDAGPPNAAVIGASPDTATIVVTRTLLEALSRDQIQSVMGHLLASVANGDLRLGIETLAVAQTFGLLMTALEAPLNATARRTLWRILRNAVVPGPANARDYDAIVSSMMAALEPGTIVETGGFIDAPDRPGVGKLEGCLLHVRFLLLLPLFGVILVAKLFLFLGTLVVVFPAMWGMLRHRRYLADATTVQLTRNPEGLASALDVLGREGGIERSASLAAHLFIVGNVVRRTKGLSNPMRREDDPAPLLLAGAHPPVAARVRRLRRFGAPATVAAPADVAAPAAEARSFLGLPDVGPVWRAVALVVAAAIVVPLAAYLVAFFGYFLMVALLFGVGVVVGAYAAAMWLVAQLLP